MIAELAGERGFFRHRNTMPALIKMASFNKLHSCLVPVTSPIGLPGCEECIKKSGGGTVRVGWEDE
jgi:hypothetical protein